MTSILKVDTIQDTDGNNIINESGNTITIGASGDTTNIIGTLQNDGAAVGGANTPTFISYVNGSQSIGNNTTTNVVLTESYDSDNAFASNTFTVPSGKAGRYWLGAKLMFYEPSNDISMAIIYIKKNGTQALYLRNQFSSNVVIQNGINVSGILDLAVGDAITLDVYATSGSGGNTVFGSSANGESTFSGFKLIT